MNGLPTPPPWQEARTPEGKVYYYNIHTKATQWTKPIELMTPVEVRRFICIIKGSTDSRSVPCHSSHGKNILPRKGGSTGRIQKQRPALGRCQKPTRMHLLRHNRPRDQHHSESQSPYGTASLLTILGHPHLSQAEPPPCHPSLHLATEMDIAPQTAGNPRDEATTLV
jgi:hypothetical protein